MDKQSDWASYGMVNAHWGQPPMCSGYIESWGRGIQKICDACKNLGADEPVYIVHGEDIMVKFHALQSAKVSAPKVPKHPSTADFGALDDALVQKILDVLRQKPEISQSEMAEELGTTRRVIQKKMTFLKEAGCIERIGGKRYGHWI
jgi:ATP-dependent DNA helicase RecG